MEADADRFIDEDQFPTLAEIKSCLDAVQFEMQEELKRVRTLLKRPNMEFVTVSGEEFLLEVVRLERGDRS